MLVLSIFPGIDILGLAFESVGDCVVRGPDPVWGGDIHTFHPPPGRFNGVIGGPPCQAFSRFRHLFNRTSSATQPNLIPEFERVVAEAAPDWFLMENVIDAPLPIVAGYGIAASVVDNRWVGGLSSRLRRFSFGLRNRDPVSLTPYLDIVALEQSDWLPAALASGGLKPGTERERRQRKAREYGYNSAYTLAVALEAQGLPATFLDDTPFTVAGKQQLIGNGVPLPLGQALARAVHQVIDLST